MALAPKGVDIRASGARVVFRVSLKDSAGAKVTSGTATLRLWEVQDDGSLKTFDFNDNTFKSTAVTTETANLTHRTANNSTTTTGVWTYALTVVSGFTSGAVYIAQVSHSSASPTEQEREFQYGGTDGDMVVQTGDTYARVGAPAGASVSADVASIKADTGTTLPGRLPAALVGGRIDAAVGAYQTSQDPETRLLVTPANKIKTDASNRVEASSVQGNVTGSIGSLAAQAKADVRAQVPLGMDDGGYTGDRANKLDDLDSPISAVPDGVWAYSAAALTVVGSVGKYIKDSVDALLSRIASALTITAGKVDVNDKSGFSLAAAERVKLAAAQPDYVPARAGDNMGLSAPALADVNAEVDGALQDYDGATTPQLNARTLPSASYALEGTLTALKGAGWTTETLKAVKDAIDLTLRATAYTAPDNDTLADIDSRLPASPAAAGDVAAAVQALLSAVGTRSAPGDAMALTAGERNSAADALLSRNIRGGSTSGRRVYEALAAQRNRVAFDVPVAGQFTVFEEDDVTPLWTGTFTTSPSADPVTAIDPA